MHLAEETRQREKTLKETIARFESELASLKQQLNRKVTEVKKNEEELRKRQVKVLFDSLSASGCRKVSSPLVLEFKTRCI